MGMAGMKFPGAGLPAELQNIIAFIDKQLTDLGKVLSGTIGTIGGDEGGGTKSGKKTGQGILSQWADKYFLHAPARPIGSMKLANVDLYAGYATLKTMQGAVHGVSTAFKLAYAPIEGVIHYIGKLGKTTMTMGKGMLMMSLVTQPVQALLEGLLEPFSVISDLFGTIGEMLSLAFIPAMNVLTEAFMPIMPLFMELANVLAGPFAAIMTAIAGPLAEILKALLPPFTQFISIIAGPLSAGIVFLLEPLTNLAKLLNGGISFGDFIQGLITLPTRALGAIIEYISKIDWNQIGTIMNGVWIAIRDAVKEAFNKLADLFKEFFSNLEEEIKSGGKTKTKWFG